MSQKDIDIADMQCWVLRNAQKQWGISPEECSRIFKDNGVLAYIRDCYELLHVSSYQHALDDVQDMLLSKGGIYGQAS